MLSFQGASGWKRFINQYFFDPPRLIFLGFALVIAIGTMLLQLPAATRGPASLPFLDALFTATSATCVTGLIVVDTGTVFSPLGQWIILALFQIGGLGIMTLSTFFVFLVSGRISGLSRDILIDTFSQNPIADLRRLLLMVLLFTFVVEAVGSLVLTWRFTVEYAFWPALKLGVFHAVSAFCNAGFTLFTGSFVEYTNDAVINLTLMMLIILGGLGFVVILDVLERIRHKSVHKKLTFHSRLVLVSTVVLLVSGALLFFWFERANQLQPLPAGGKLFGSLFQSVTARTAGFNTLDISQLTNASLFLLILLMFIGASPGSCGGGIKTTTFMVLVAWIHNHARMQRDVNIFHRRIPDDTLSRVITVSFFSLLLVILFTMLLILTQSPSVPHPETGGLFLDILFEAVSAFGTVGLSTGITSELSPVGKILITLLMFIGRLGPLTVTLALRGKHGPAPIRYIKDDVLIG